LAEDILRHAATLIPQRSGVRFLDPAFGTGSFFSALLRVFPRHAVSESLGFEIDAHYAKPAAQLWASAPLSLKLADFFRQPPTPTVDLLVCNPPYVRHHHIASNEKAQLQAASYKASGAKLSGLAGLYCHFIAQSHAWLADGAVSIWLIPSEFMDVNYGSAIKRYLLERVTLLHIHRFDPNDVQFADALVSSAIVCFRNTLPESKHSVLFTFGGTLAGPRITRQILSRALAQEPKWTRFPTAPARRRTESPRLADFFTVKRGLATGDNKYFILSATEIEKRELPLECFRPILPSPRYLPSDEIEGDDHGIPRIASPLFLLDTRLSEAEIEKRHPSLFSYLQEGRLKGLHERYLCSHRALWYGQEERPPAPIVCTYLGRGDKKNGRPFRFILNQSRATVANVYLAMYPTPWVTRALETDPELVRKVWRCLNRIKAEELLGKGRVYGGGLHKLEPRELSNVAVPGIAALLGRPAPTPKQADLF
jgi:hypothetical protein